MCIALAIGGAAVAGLAGSAISAHAAGSAADKQAASAANAQQISQNEFNTITGQEQPFMNSGYGAQSQLNYLLGIGSPGGGQQGRDPSSGFGIGAGGAINRGIPGMSTGTQGMGTTPQTASSSPAGGYGSLLSPFTAQNFHQMSPAYQFQLQQGQQGVLNTDSGSQGALSGAAMKDLTGYNQGMANTSFNNAFNQYQTQQGNIYSRLSDIASRGQNAASNTGQQGTALAGQAAQSATNIGSAQAAGSIGTGNAWSGGINNVGSLASLYGMGAFNSSGGGVGNVWATGPAASAGSFDGSMG
jgi:hypothetical protein